MNEETMKKLLAVATELRPTLYTQMDSSVTISFDSRGTTVNWTVNDGAGGSESSSKRIAAKVVTPAS